MATRPENVEQYMASVPDGQRATLQEVRAVIRSAAPDAVESIAYGLPAYKHLGKPLVYFGAAKNHWALYGLVGDEHPEALAAYEVSRGTIRFPWHKPVPADVIKLVVGTRVATIEATATKGKAAK